MLQQILTEMKAIKGIQEELKTIQTEMKTIKESQAVVERDVAEIRQYQHFMRVTIDKLDRNQAVMEQGINTLRADAAEMKDDITGIKGDITDIKRDVVEIKEDIEEIKEKAEFTAVVLESTLKMTDELDQKWKAM
jgi:chromosome segregation ATPase